LNFIVLDGQVLGIRRCRVVFEVSLWVGFVLTCVSELR
jgi:hypothetical protein